MLTQDVAEKELLVECNNINCKHRWSISPGNYIVEGNRIVAGPMISCPKCGRMDRPYVVSITKDSIMECPYCKSTFQKDHVRTRMRKWGKDSFYSTKHCPNCDKRILLRDDNPDIESVNTRLSKLRTYCNYCKMNGQFDEYRDAMGETLELQKQIEDMRNGEMKSKVKDRNIEINQGLEYTIEEKDKILEKFGGKVHFIYSGGGYFRIDKLDDSIKGKLMFLSQRSSDSKKLMKDAALVALKGLDEVKKQVKDAYGDITIKVKTPSGVISKTLSSNELHRYSNTSNWVGCRRYVENNFPKGSELLDFDITVTSDKKTKDATNYMGERTFQTYEAWKRACKQIDPNVKFDGDKDICQAKPGIGEWDGERGIIYNTKDRKTKDEAIRPEIKKKLEYIFYNTPYSKNYQDWYGRFMPKAKSTGATAEEIQEFLSDGSLNLDSVKDADTEFEQLTKELNFAKKELTKAIKAANRHATNNMVTTAGERWTHEQAVQWRYKVEQLEKKIAQLKTNDADRKLGMQIFSTLDTKKLMKDAALVALKGLDEVRKQMKDRKTKDDVLISHYKGYMITTNGNKFQATNTVRQIDAFSKEELYRKVDDIEEKRAKMREINRRNADSKTKDINPPSDSERIKNDFESGRKDHNAGYYDKWYRWNRKDNGRAYDDGFNSVAGKPVQIIEAMHDSKKTKDSKRTKDGNGEQALDKCRHSLFPVANELATIASSSIYEDRIRKAAKKAEQLVDEARHVLFDAI